MRNAAFALALIALGLPGIAAAEPAVVLVVEGWDRKVDGDVTSYRCASAGCPSGSAVSYKRQPHRPGLARSTFEDHHMRRARDAPDASGGQITFTAIHGLEDRTLDAVRILSINQETVWTDGSESAHVDSLLTGPAAAFSFVSDASNSEDARTIFDAFLPRMIDIVRLAETPGN